MFEVMDTQVIPIAATAVGFTAGIIGERKAIERAASERQTLVEAWSLEDEQPVTAQPNRLGQLTGRVGRYVTAVTVSAGLAAGLTAEAWLPIEESASQQRPPALEVVVDHSGATALPLSGKPSLGEINQVVGQLQGIHNVSAEAWVASSSRVKDIALNKVAGEPAFGDAPLEQAMQSALDRAGFAVSNHQGAEHSAGVIAITNGNEVGAPQAVAQEAKAKGGVPVFVVNVEGNRSSAIPGLQRIAQLTNGKYWGANAANLNSVAENVDKTISATQHEVGAKPVVADGAQTFLRFLSALSWLGVGVAFAKRRKTPFERNLRGE